MQSSQQPEVQVVIPAPRSNEASQRLPRPLVVDEALRFSPMTSAPVFALDSIMRPDIGHPSLSNWPAPYDANAAGKMIDTLDNETQAGAKRSTHLTTIQENLRTVLTGDNLTTFKFNLPPGTSSSEPPEKSQGHGDGLSSHHLGPFAKMVLDSSNIPYRFPSPATPSPQKSGIPSKPLPTPVSDRKPSKTPSQGGEGNLKPVIMVPSLPAAPQDEYKPIHDSSEGKRRKPDGLEDGVQDLQMRDQKELSDAALVKLQDLMQEIFEAEDQLQPDTSAQDVRSNNKYFTASTFVEEGNSVLSSDAHAIVQKTLRNVAGFGRLGDISTEYMNRLQKLCEPPVLSAHSLDLALVGEPTDAETEAWSRKLEEMHNCLLSIGTLLHTMSGSVEIGDLCPEETVRSIPVALNHVFDNCIIPAVECRVRGKNSELFNVFSNHRQILGRLVNQSRKILNLLASFVSSVDLAEDTITAMEFLIIKLVFVENAHNDKESALGYQKYENVRRSAMDVLGKIFAKYPDQRPFILDEILVSLEKLPSSKQSARQFKLLDGKHIQLLSALVIQLVQTTALQKATGSRGSKRESGSEDMTKTKGNSDASAEDADEPDSDDDTKGSGIDRLSHQVEPLFDNAVRSAQYITRYIVQRAMTSTKTGDQPYRNLLDLFTEDLIHVLGSPDWPGAELLLRVLASQMVGIADHDKSPANAKNMALELLGWMGSAISELTSTAQHLSKATDESDTDLAEYLRHLCDDHLNHTLHLEDLIISDGPYRVILEYLDERDVGKSQLGSTRGYLLAQWGKTVCSVYLDGEENKTASSNYHGQSLARTLNNILSSPRWIQVNSEFERIPTQQARLAYLLTVLNNGFCKAFDTIVKVLLGSITSEQAKVRSRSLKSVIQMLERDPSLLDRDESILSTIFKCATDSSPMVRDSALTLIARFITLRPALEEDCGRAILACSSDPTLGVRKRCIGLMRDIYVQTKRQDLRLPVIEKLLQRMTDHEESVVVLARQTLEELWFAPFYQTIAHIQNSPQVKVNLDELVTLIVDCVRNSGSVASTLEIFLRRLLKEPDKAESPNFEVCKAIVAAMFDRMIQNSDSEDKLTLPALLQSITVFAKAKARLFTPDQLETLHPYIGHLASADDLLLFRSVVVIYRCVLPNISTTHNTLLKNVQNDLFKSVSKLARTELNEVMACLWTINGVLQNTERLVRLAISVLKGIKQTSSIKLDGSTNSDLLGRVRSYIRIAGCVGKHCDLEKFYDHFAQTFPETKAGSVAGLIVHFIAPYTQTEYPRELRLMALESLGSVCQSWPAQFGREEARSALTSVFEEDDKDLKAIVLNAFLDFFSIHEGKSEKSLETDSHESEPSSRLGGSLRASDNDGAAALIAQNFLRQILQAALSGQDQFALTAIELIASVNRQGLIHPKESAGVLVALETSTNPAISNTAFESHKMLHQQHESMFDREYMRAVQDAFNYQRDIVGDTMGALHRPFSSKLAPLFEVIKISSSKYQKKFLTNLCSKLDFDLKKLDVSANPPEHLLFARFVCQNLAFFEYAQVAELVATVSSIERIVGTTGTALAHAIETDVFPTRIDQLPHDRMNPEPQGTPVENGQPPQCDFAVLKKLSVAAATLLILWETRSYLRRLYSLNSHSRQKESKANAKELNKAPVKAPGISGERYWETVARTMDSLCTIESMATICKQFTTLLSIDDELKVAGDDENDSMPSGGEAEDTGALLAATNGSKPGKRRSSLSGGNTPKKAKKGHTSNSKKRDSTDVEDNIDFN